MCWRTNDKDVTFYAASNCTLSRFFSLIEGEHMNGIKLAAIILIIGGVLGLAIGSFSYTKKTEEVKIGPIELTVKDKETVNIPVWLGAGALIAGVLLLVVRSKK